MIKGGHGAAFCTCIFVQGSVYKKANPRADINPESRDKFWDQQEVYTRVCVALVALYIHIVLQYVCTS